MIAPQLPHGGVVAAAQNRRAQGGFGHEMIDGEARATRVRTTAAIVFRGEPTILSGPFQGNIDNRAAAHTDDLGTDRFEGGGVFAGGACVL